MAPNLDRRNLLRAGALVVVAPAVGPVAAGSAVAAPLKLPAGPVAAPAGPVPPAAWRVQPFGLGDVTLAKGSVFAAKRDLMTRYARKYRVDRLLQVFRANAGLPTDDAVAPGGWEGLDGEANGNLRGHYTGHFLTMLSQLYASTGDHEYAKRIRHMVDALVEVRDALRADPVVLRGKGRFSRGIEHVRGSYRYLDLPATVLGDAPAITISGWVRPTHETNWARVFDFGNDTNRYLYLAARTDTGVPRFAITTAGAGGEQVINGSAPLPLDTWSHLAVTISGSTGTLYVDGVAVGVNTAMTLNPAALGPLRNNWLGRSNYPGDPVFSGAFDDVNIWSRALTQAELTGLQQTRAAKSAAGPGDLASYPCDKVNGGVLVDASGHGRHATVRRTWGGPSHPGFLAAYPETQFITLESMTRGDYTRVWAPYYTADKILRGVLDAYRSTNDERALDLATGMCDWMYSRLSRLPVSTRQRMWGLFSSGEFGGLVEAICDLHAITGKAEHLALARLFDLDRLIDACATDRDILTNLHANQHIPILTGLVRLYDQTGEQRYLTAARNFWAMVVPTRMYSIGGTSTVEFWRAPRSIAGTLSETNAETCCAYNMLKLSRMLFFHEPDPKYMDFYERALYNQILGSKQDRADAEKPLVTYFIGLVPGHVRDYTPKAGTTCCEGTGMESATKYQDSVFFRSADDSALFVNLYSAATLAWTAKGVQVTQTTAYPVEQGATITVSGDATFDLLLRVPSWARAGFEVTVNGRAVAGSPVPGTYFPVSRSWRTGDVVRIRMPFRLRVEKAVDDPGLQTLFYGPVNLVGYDARRTYLQLGLYANAALSGDLRPTLAPVSGGPLRFRLGEVEFGPFFEGTEQPTHVYFRRTEPRVVFGGVDSGVANPARADGTSLLDEIWAAAPFVDKAQLVQRVRTTADAWVAAGALTTEAATTVVATAAAATYPA